MSLLAVARLYFVRTARPFQSIIKNADLLKNTNKTIPDKWLLLLELAVIAAFCFAPLLFKNPYRLNIFLTWEGAYRLFLDQVPFRDFSLPMGYGFWVIPALFFKLFGPYMASLIKAQVFINLVAVFSFRGILNLLGVRPVHIFFSVLVFCFSYVSFNFWPWYNHLVIVLQLAAMFCALRAVFTSVPLHAIVWSAASAFLCWFSIFTKQDGGILASMIVFAIYLYDWFSARDWRKTAAFTASYVLLGLALILPLLKYEFLYWFNYGQAPHNSRLHLVDFLNQILGWAYWEKFFLFVIFLLVADKIRGATGFLSDRRQVLLAFVCTAMILEALIIQVTSNKPDNGEAFFYAFGFAYILANIRLSFSLNDYRFFGAALVLTVFWWTGIYWRNVQRILVSKPVIVEKMEKTAPQKYRLAREYRSLDNLYLSESTLGGIERILNMEIFRSGRTDVRVLNMSELTSLAYEVPFTPITGQPLWFHQGVSIFQKEVDEFSAKVKNGEYDVVLFQTIPENEVINFFPSDVKKVLDVYYDPQFTFLAPRSPEESFITVYTKKK